VVLSSQSVSKPTTTTSNVPIPTNFLPAVLTNDSRPQSRIATVLLTEPDNKNNGQRFITGGLLNGGTALRVWQYPSTEHQSPNKVARSKGARPHALLDGRMASATAFRGTVVLLVDSVIPRGGGNGRGICRFNARIGVFGHPNIKASFWKHADTSSAITEF
jgi:hypothetical protein